MPNFYAVTFIFGSFNWRKFVYETADKHRLIVCAHDEEEAKELFRVQSEYAYGKKKTTILRIDPYVDVDK